VRPTSPVLWEPGEGNFPWLPDTRPSTSASSTSERPPRGQSGVLPSPGWSRQQAQNATRSLTVANRVEDRARGFWLCATGACDSDTGCAKHVPPVRRWPVPQGIAGMVRRRCWLRHGQVLARGTSKNRWRAPMEVSGQMHTRSGSPGGSDPGAIVSARFRGRSPRRPDPLRSCETRDGAEKCGHFHACEERQAPTGALPAGDGCRRE
jgi:hypothetical protein